MVLHIRFRRYITYDSNVWLGQWGSNPRITGSKPDAFPLCYTLALHYSKVISINTKFPLGSHTLGEVRLSYMNKEDHYDIHRV